MGNALELGYLQSTIEQQAAQRLHLRQDHSTRLIVHSILANEGRTDDGIVAGGARVADEVNSLLDRIVVSSMYNTTTTTVASASSSSSSSSSPDPRQFPTISLSFVGNSLGGLYARYALSQIPSLSTLFHRVKHSGDGGNNRNNHDEGYDDDECSNPKTSDEDTIVDVVVQPAVFCTTATPHLGLDGNTYLKTPRWMEWIIASTLSKTGRDLFRFTPILDQMATEAIYLSPLQRFRKRMAYCNVHQTDFQVPTATAAFLSPITTTSTTGNGSLTPSSSWNRNHRILPRYGDQITRETFMTHSSLQQPQLQTQPILVPDFEILRVETIPRQGEKGEVHASMNEANENGNARLSSAQLASNLDNVGWIKVFCDVRPHLIGIRIPRWLWPGRTSTGSSIPTTCHAESIEPPGDNQQDRMGVAISGGEILEQLGTYDNQEIHIPFGHTQLVANSKNEWYAKWNAGGRPIMDQLASELLDDLLDGTGRLTTTTTKTGIDVPPIQEPTTM